MSAPGHESGHRFRTRRHHCRQALGGEVYLTGEGLPQLAHFPESIVVSAFGSGAAVVLEVAVAVGLPLRGLERLPLEAGD